MFSSLWVSEKYKNTSLGYKVKKVLYQEQSDYQLVEIFETHDWGRILMLDGLMMLSEKDEFFYHETIVHLPMASNPKAERVLVIGGGDGGTVRELAKYKGIKDIHLVEIDGKVVEASKKFLPSLSSSLSDPRVRIVLQDAAEFIKTVQEASYDLILADSSDPEGFAASLIESEFYRMVKRALKPDGLFVAQSGSILSQREEIQKTWNNLQTVFPHQEIAWSIIPTYPGAWWSFVLASQQKIQRPEKDKPQHHITGCKFWKPEMLDAMLCRPGFLSDLLMQSKSV